MKEKVLRYLRFLNISKEIHSLGHYTFYIFLFSICLYPHVSVVASYIVSISFSNSDEVGTLKLVAEPRLLVMMMMMMSLVMMLMLAMMMLVMMRMRMVFFMMRMMIARKIVCFDLVRAKKSKLLSS